jgi:hypothetical protein
MGTLTGSQFQDELLLALDQRTDAGASPTRLLRWINHAYFHMTYPTIHAFEALRTTYDITLGANDADYALDATTVGYQVLAVHNMFHLEATVPTFSTRRTRLKSRNIRWYDERQHSNGPPRFYVTGQGEQVFVTPVPGAAEAGQILRLRLWREPALLTAGTTTVVPNYFDEVLLLGAQAVGEYRLGYRDRARETLEHYVAMLNDPKQKDEIEGEDWGLEAQLRGEPIMGVST